MTNENPNMRMYILQHFFCKAGKSVRRLLLPAMKKIVNDNRRMPLRWRSESREQRRDFVYFIFGEELFAAVGAAKHGYDALSMRNVFRKIPRREGDVTEEGQ